MPYDLFCFISGHHSIFPESIDETELVGNLKEKIKERTKPKLNDIAAHDLTLYRVEVDICRSASMSLNDSPGS